MGVPPSLLQALQQDPAIEIDADYILDKFDRLLIDSQAIAAEYHLLKALLLGRVCSWYTLDRSSGVASRGDVVCSAGTASTTVTRALSTPLQSAGAPLGIVISGGSPGAKILVATGGLLPPSVTGLTTVSTTAVVNTGTARAGSGSLGYALGFIDAAGNLLLSPGPSNGSNQPNFFPYVDVSNQIGGIPVCDGPGFTPTTAGVRFMPHVAGSVIAGMRFIWATPFTGVQAVKCSLWTPTSGPNVAATVTLPNLGPGIAVATFSTPYTVLPADVDGVCTISTYSFYSGTGGGYYVETSWHSNTSLGNANVPVFASPLFSYGDGSSGDHTHGNVFGVTTVASSETLPATEFGQSRYFAMEPIFQ